MAPMTLYSPGISWKTMIWKVKAKTMPHDFCISEALEASSSLVAYLVARSVLDTLICDTVYLISTGLYLQV